MNEINDFNRSYLKMFTHCSDLEKMEVEYNAEKQNHSSTKSVSDNLALQLEKERTDLTTQMNDLIMKTEGLKNELIKEKENSSLLTNTLSEEKEKIQWNIKELDADKAEIKSMQEELKHEIANHDATKTNLNKLKGEFDSETQNNAANMEILEQERNNLQHVMDNLSKEVANHLATKNELEIEKINGNAIKVQLGTESSNANLVRINRIRANRGCVFYFLSIPF